MIRLMEDGETPGGTVHKARADNPNRQFANLPGAPQVTTDLAGNPISTTPGEIGASGSIGAKRAQRAADAGLERGRAAGADLQNTMNNMVKSGTPEVPAEIPKAPKTSFAAPGTAVQTTTAPTGLSTQPNPLAQQLTTGAPKPPGTIATALGQMPEKDMGMADVVDTKPKLSKPEAGAPPAQLAAPSDAAEAERLGKQAKLKAELQGRRAAGNSVGTQQSGFGQLANKEAQITKSLQSAGVDVAKSAEQATANVAAKLGGKAALKGAGKIISKFIPGVGLAFGTMDAIARAQSGDWLGAGIAGAGAALSIVPGLGGMAATGLDAINMGRDLAKGDAQGVVQPGGSPTGTTGDTKLKQLQQMIGAKPDGIMGPDTKAKLQAWQQKQGIKADGLPGPETYGKAGIKESQQSAAEGIRNLQERLQLIESKAIIRESLEQTYYLDENYYMYDSSGEQVTDLLTISVINEAYENGQVQLQEAMPGFLGKLGQYAMAPGNFIGGLRRGSGQVAKSGELGSKAVAKLADKVGGAKGAGLKTGAAIARNPYKSMAAAGAAGLGAGYLGGKLAGGNETPITPPGPTGKVDPDKPIIQPPKPPPDIQPDDQINQAELDEMDQLARYIAKFSDPSSAEAMGQYNAIRDKLPKATPAPGEMEESIARYIRKVNRKR